MQWIVEKTVGNSEETAGEGAAPKRLDAWLAKQSGRARNQVQQDIDADRVAVDGKPASGSMRLRGGERVEYQIPDALSTRVEAEDIPLKIVYEDEALLVIDKPVGLVVHPAPGHASGTLVNALLAHCGPSLEGVGVTTESGPRWGIVHRLDAMTSGLMLAAKTQPAYEALTAMLAARTVKRQYLAIALGRFDQTTGTVDKPLGRRPNQRKLMGVLEEEKGGRAARTDYEALIEKESLTLLALTLHTGRTHQIRVHLQSIGRPVLGDIQYGWTKARTIQAMSQMFRAELAVVWPERQLLHAARLTLRHPLDEERVLDFASRPPEDMQHVLDAAHGEAAKVAMNRWFERAVELPMEAIDEMENDEADDEAGLI